jgi:hypothetical protein
MSPSVSTWLSLHRHALLLKGEIAIEAAFNDLVASPCRGALASSGQRVEGPASLAWSHGLSSLWVSATPMHASVHKCYGTTYLRRAHRRADHQLRRVVTVYPHELAYLALRLGCDGDGHGRRVLARVGVGSLRAAVPPASIARHLQGRTAHQQACCTPRPL